MLIISMSFLEYLYTNARCYCADTTLSIARISISMSQYKVIFYSVQYNAFPQKQFRFFFRVETLKNDFKCTLHKPRTIA